MYFTARQWIQFLRQYGGFGNFSQMFYVKVDLGSRGRFRRGAHLGLTVDTRPRVGLRRVWLHVKLNGGHVCCTLRHFLGLGPSGR